MQDDHPARRAGRRNQEHGAHHRRDRHRQGAGGPRDPRPQRAARHAAHQGELRGDPRVAARIGALRPRPRRVHRRDDDQEGQVRAGRRRHDLPRRDRHDDARRCSPSCCACCRSASSSRSARSAPRRSIVRVIAATNRDLRQMVADGRFQEDLFYRLNVIPIELPPLRERRDDIPALVEHFVRKHAQRTGRRVERIDDGVLAALQQYDWPGNVRELENTIERAVVLSTGPVITARAISSLGAPRRSSYRPAVVEAAAEHRMGRARNDPARARKRSRRQEGRRGADGHQSARAVVLSREVPDRLTSTVQHLRGRKPSGLAARIQRVSPMTNSRPAPRHRACSCAAP